MDNDPLAELQRSFAAFNAEMRRRHPWRARWFSILTAIHPVHRWLRYRWWTIRYWLWLRPRRWLDDRRLRREMHDATCEICGISLLNRRAVVLGSSNAQRTYLCVTCAKQHVTVADSGIFG